MRAKYVASLHTLGRWLPYVLGSCVLTAVGCLVTNKVEYGEPNFPAQVVAEEPPTSSLPRVPDDPECGDTTTERDDGDWMRFRFSVSDPNVEDPLLWRIIVNGDYFTGGEFLVPGTVARGTVDLCVTEDILRNACNLVEVLVTRRFSEEGFPYRTADPDDVGRISWLVLGRSSLFLQASALDCTAADGGVQ